MKKRIPGILSLIVLTVSYWVLRFPLFGLHQMKDWSFCMFALGAILIGFFGIFRSQKYLSLFAGAGYGLCFFIGYLFQFDYGIGLNSIWIIWTCSYLVFIFIGAVWDFIGRYKGKNTKP